VTGAEDPQSGSVEDAALLAELYEEAPCGYLSTQPDGTIIRVNRTFELWTGHQRADLVRKRRLSDLLTPGGRIYHETHYAPLLQMQGAVREIAVEIVRADGTRLPVLVNSVLHRDGDGRPSVVRTTVFDATDRRHYERELLIARRRAEGLQRHTALLAETSRALDEVHGVAERAQRLVDLLVPGVVQGAVVLVGDPPQPLAAAGEHTDDPALQEALKAAVATRGSRLGDAPAADAGEDAEAPVAAVPLLAGGNVIGALGVTRARLVDGVRASDLPALEGVADRAALALENARLYEHEQEVAHALQRSMLAGALPRHPGCAIGTYYSPAIDTLAVGGDWYDAFFLRRDQLVLVVGDVVGRGLEAAATMGQLRSAVRALAGAQLGPARVLEHLDTFVERAENGRGATVAYVELDLADGSMALACAGHPPPILVPPGAPAELLWGGRSAPLGAYAGPSARDQLELTLERGSRLLLYTDGLVERRDRPIDEGIERLMGMFERGQGTRVTAVGDALSVQMLADGHGADDVCVLTLALGSTEPFQMRLQADAERLRGMRADLGRWLDGHGVRGRDRDAIVLACAEAAANAIEHGYRGTDGVIRIAADCAPGEVTIEVDDRGAWRFPTPGRGGRGRGLMIIENLMDEVLIERGGGAGGTRITMRRQLREPV
jgi:serine/threonine-protein kinase RsbW